MLLGTLLLVISSASVGAYDINNEALIDHRDTGAPRSLLAVNQPSVEKSSTKAVSTLQTNGDDDVRHTGLPDAFVRVDNGKFKINGLPVRPLTMDCLLIYM